MSTLTSSENINAILQEVENLLPRLPEMERSAESSSPKRTGNAQRGTTSELFRRQLGVLGDIPLEVSIELGRASMYLEDVARLRRGSVVVLDRLAGEPVDVLVNGRIIARGELLVVDGHFSVRLTEFV